MLTKFRENICSFQLVSAAARNHHEEALTKAYLINDIQLLSGVGYILYLSVLLVHLILYNTV